MMSGLRRPLLADAEAGRGQEDANLVGAPRYADGQAVESEEAEGPQRCRSAIGVMMDPSGVEKLDLLEAFDSRPLPGSGTSNELQTVFNTVNLYVGIGLLTVAYAVKLGGWLSLGFLGLFSTLFCYSAVLICRSFAQLPPSMLPSYPNLGLAACGSTGQWLVMLVALTEFFGALCMCLIVVWQSWAMLLPSNLDQICIFNVCIAKRWAVILGSSLVVLPATWIRSFSRLTGIAITGVASSALLTLVVVSAYLKDPTREAIKDPASEEHDWLNLPGLPVAAGILIVSLSGHAGLPSLRRSMRRPQNFERCLFLAFLLMFCLYALMGGVGYLYFGRATRVLITQNLTDDSSMASVNVLSLGGCHLSVGRALSLLVSVSAYATIPPLVFVVTELLLDIAFQQPKTEASNILVAAVRTLVVLGGYLTSIVMYDVLGSLESLVGGVGSVCSSLLLPALFYYRMHSRLLTTADKVVLGSLMLFGAAATLWIAFVNIQNLRHGVPPG